MISNFDTIHTHNISVRLSIPLLEYLMSLYDKEKPSDKDDFSTFLQDLLIDLLDIDLMSGFYSDEPDLDACYTKIEKKDLPSLNGKSSIKFRLPDSNFISYNKVLEFINIYLLLVGSFKIRFWVFESANVPKDEYIWLCEDAYDNRFSLILKDNKWIIKDFVYPDRSKIEDKGVQYLIKSSDHQNCPAFLIGFYQHFKDPIKFNELLKQHNCLID